jgi:4-hydroxy-tetrahydrodipicolinate synthase
MTTWQGVFPAVTTKMDQSGRINVAATSQSVARLIDGGVAGVVVLPMLGENASLAPAEREAIIRAAVETAAGRVPVLSGLAESTLESARANARHYESCGAQGLMVFPNLVYKTDPRETVFWYREIAAASSLPIMIYNNPIAYGVDVTPRILESLADTKEIVCVKEESGDIRRVTDIKVALGDRFSVFCGVDDLIVESLALGVTGWVSGMTNAWPRECVELFDLCRAERFADARKLYRILTPSFHLDIHVKLVQYIKLAESLVYGAPEWTRPPRLPLVGAERDSVIATLRKTMADLAQRDGGSVGAQLAAAAG